MTNDADTVREPDPAQAPGPRDEHVLSPPAAEHAFFIVGIGASAGGLDALVELTRHVPLDHMAFVVVQHLAPDHGTLMTQLLSRSSNVRVVTATDGMVVEAHRIHVIPPNVSPTIVGGVLRLSTLLGEQRGRLPIDVFFRALARDHGSAAIGVVLSGTGTDGTLGLAAIEEAGGLTFVQDPASAKFDGMPTSALASGHADACLTPDGISAELRRLAGETSCLPRLDGEPLAQLYALIHTTFGNDLAAYKKSTVERRLARRLRLRKVPDLATYVEHLRADSVELNALYRDMLITVTSFFRDREVFAALAAQVLPRFLDPTSQQGPIRIWVPACATGEEVYSIAIELVELVEAMGVDVRIQIFATDIDDASIRHARLGTYSDDIALDVSPDRLQRHFVPADGGYRISRKIRDLVTFSKHNLLTDAPFSRIDLVSCRNLLIYLQPAAQRKVLELLHYALTPRGCLLLGSSETVGDVPELFAVIDRKAKLYARRPNGAPPPRFAPTPVGARGIRPAAIARRGSRLDVIADRKVLDLFGPPGVVISEAGEILRFRGETGPYLNPVPGAASVNLLRLARPELHTTLRRTIEQALADDMRVTGRESLPDGDAATTIVIDAVPLSDGDPAVRSVLVLFRSEPVADGAEPAASEAIGDGARSVLATRVRHLERELAASKEHLRSTVQEFEDANEDLKATNEELQSANEELQSANEELETSKEEIEATNEEIVVINDELQSRISEVGDAHDDLRNILAGVDHAVIVVDMELRIRRYTLAAERLFALVPADCGRSIERVELIVPGVRELVAEVLTTLTTIDQEILGGNRRWYGLRIAAYHAHDHAVKGAVLTLADIDVVRRARDRSSEIGEYASRFLGVIAYPLLMVDHDLRVVWANAAFYARFQVVPEETLGSRLASVGAWNGATAELVDQLQQTLASGKSFRDRELTSTGDRGEVRSLRIGASRIPLAADPALALLSIEERDGPDNVGVS